MRRIVLIIYLIALLMPIPAHTQETAPGSSCAAGENNYIRAVGGPETSGVWHLMRCDGSNWGQRLTALANGNVGIGTASPNASLEVEAPVSSDPSFALSDGDVNQPITAEAQADQFFYLKPISSTVGGAALQGFNENGNASGIDLRGYLGSTAPVATVPAVAVRGYKKSGTTAAIALANNETVFGIYNGSSALPAFSMLGNGNVGVSNVSPNVALDVSGDIEYTGTLADMSDRRLKSDIRYLPPGQLDNIMRLKPVSFIMKNDAQQQRELGLIAQDVEPVFPELVGTGDSSGMRSMNYIGLLSP